MTEERRTIMERILNLRELAQSTASEAEAMNAMAVADKMMAAYRVEEAELAMAEGLDEIRVEIVDETKFDVGLNVGRNRHKVQTCIWALEQYCEVEVVLKIRGSKQGIHVIGDAPDVQLFWWMLDLIRDAMDRSYANWKRTQQAVGRGAKASFQLSMGARIAARLEEMTRERSKERKETEAEAAKLLNKPKGEVGMVVSNTPLSQLPANQSLVLLSAVAQKREAVQSAYAAAYKGVRLGTASGFSYRAGTSAASAGRAAGNRLGLGRPIGGSSRKRLT